MLYVLHTYGPAGSLRRVKTLHLRKVQHRASKLRLSHFLGVHDV